MKRRISTRSFVFGVVKRYHCKGESERFEHAKEPVEPDAGGETGFGFVHELARHARSASEFVLR